MVALEEQTSGSSGGVGVELRLRVGVVVGVRLRVEMVVGGEAGVEEGDPVGSTRLVVDDAGGAVG